MTTVASEYRGNCHCGRIRFKIKTAPITSAVSCECDVCRKTDHLWVHVPLDDFESQTNYAQDLTFYGTGSKSHEFCNVCGIGVFGTCGIDANGSTIAIYIRALQGVNPFDLDISREKQRSQIDGGDGHNSVDSHDAPSRADGPKVCTGSCACGKVRIEVQSPPLPTVEVKEDNCSICVRTGLVGIYPHQSDVVISGREHSTDYVFARRFNGHPFCSTCGVLVFLNLHGPPREVIDRLPEARRRAVEKMLQIQPVNVRALDGVEWSELKINRTDEGTEGYELAEL